MECPRCHKMFQSHSIGEHTVDVCESCDGMLVQQKHLIRLLETIYAGIAAAGEGCIEEQPAKVPDQGGGLSCPLCGETMGNSGYQGTHVVFIDRCSSCWLLFIDGGEVGPMAMLHARTTHHVESNRAFQSEWVAGFVRRHWVGPSV